MTQEEQIQTLYNWVQYLYEKVLTLDKRVKELEAQRETQPESQDEAPVDNPLNMSVEKALKILDFARETGKLSEVTHMFNIAKGADITTEQAYKNIKGRLECTVEAKPGTKVGQAWLNSFLNDYKLKEPKVKDGHVIKCRPYLGAFFAELCSQTYWMKED